MSQSSSVHIVGGGFSGLMAAYFCTKKKIPVKISEGHAWGGLISTKSTPWGLVESAANSFLLTEQLRLVAQDIGVELLFPKKEARKRWVFNEKPQRWPVPALETLTGVSKFIFLRAQGSHLPRPQEILSDWGNRVLGKKFQDRLLLPGVQGIYGVDSRALSASLILNPLLKKERPRHKGSVAPQKGMQEWIEALLIWLKKNGAELREESLNSLPDSPGIVLAGSAAAKSNLLKKDFSEASAQWDQIKFCPLISVTVFFSTQKTDLEGFGVLFHPDKKGPSSGVLFNDQIFEHRSSVKSETWFFPGPKNALLSDAEILAALLQQRSALMPSANPILHSEIKRWEKALPIYSIELEKILAAGLQLPANIHLLGNEMGGIGLSTLALQAERMVHVLA